MIYLVTNEKELLENEIYQIISSKDSFNILKTIDIPAVDSETDGLDPHINKVLCLQIGDKNNQLVIDASTVDLKLYKEYLESHYLLFQNGKFDLQFLYNYGIIPRKIYDTMIVEQFLHLGYPAGSISYSLKEIAQRRLGITLDKTIRGQIRWRGLDSKVVEYAALDTVYLFDIMKSQLEDCKMYNCLEGAKVECNFIPAIAYLEWCGIKLDAEKWKAKMKEDYTNLITSENALNNFVINNKSLKEFTTVNTEGDLWKGFDTTPKVNINWSSSSQVVQIAKILGFNTIVQDKKTGEDKDSVLEKVLKTQKGINDEFLNLYFKYQEYAKTVSSFGQGHLDAINPITGRLHSIFKQLGASSGRLSCGSNQPNNDLATYKQLPKGSCKYLNLQQLPSDDRTRSCFIAEKDNNFVSCDFSAEELSKFVLYNRNTKIRRIYI